MSVLIKRHVNVSLSFHCCFLNEPSLLKDIIPLAKKLKECSVFGISSDEYLNYAMKNRKEWEHRGQEVVAEMIQKYESMYAGEQLGSQASVDC